jgi:hypothetical protein
MSIELHNRVAELERQVAELQRRLDDLLGTHESTVPTMSAEDYRKEVSDLRAYNVEKRKTLTLPKAKP